MDNKETLNNSNSTQTAVKDELQSVSKKYNISAPLFLMFAEYLGYVGKTLPWVDNWCVAKKKPEEYKIKFIEVEAATVLKEAKKVYDEKKMRELYDSLYEVILFIYDDNLKEVEEGK